MATQLSIRILASKRPLDAASFGVAFALPSTDLTTGGCLVRQPSPETLAIQDTDLDFRHVQPACVLGGVVEHDSSQKRGGSRGAEHLFEAPAEMRVEVVENQMNFSGGGIGAPKQSLYEADEIRFGSAFGNLHHPTPASGLYRHEYIAGALANVFVIELGRRSGFHGQRRTAISDQLLAFLVDADHGLSLPVRLRVHIEHIVHPPAVFLGQLADAPHHFAPGFEEVFFSSRRMLSRLIWRIGGWRRACRVSNATVQRLAPAGGEEHANAATCASSGARYRLGCPGRCTSLSAYSSPPSRYAARVRQIAVRPTPSTCMIWHSGILRLRAARMWARLNSRAMCSPLDRNPSTASRSCLFSRSSVWRIARTPWVMEMRHYNVS